VTELKHMLTPFGPLDLKLAVSKNGRTAKLNILFHDNSRLPEKIVVHKETWSIGDPVIITHPQNKIEIYIEIR
jgi:hypothetical protein